MASKDHKKGSQWQARWKDARGKAQKFTTDDLGEARRVQREENEKALEGMPGVRRRPVTVDECATLYFNRLRPHELNEHERYVRVGKSVTDGSKAVYRSRYRSQIKPELGNTVVQRLTEGDVAEYLHELHDDGALSWRYVRGIRSTLNMILEYARRNRLIAVNPVRDVHIPDLATTVPVNLTSKQVEVLASQMEPHLAAAVWLGACAGYRVSEVCGVRWQNIDAVNRRVTFDRQWDGAELVPLKTPASYATLPVDQWLIDRVEEHEKRFRYARVPAKAEYGDFLFLNQWGRPMTRKTMGLEIKKAVRDAGLSSDIPEATTYRALRRFFVATLGEAGMSPKKVQKRARHEKFETTMNVYSFAMEDETNEERGAFQAQFASTFS